MLWIGTDGPLQPHSINIMFKRRGIKAGVTINPHRFRHDFSHRYLMNGWAGSGLDAAGRMVE